MSIPASTPSPLGLALIGCGGMARHYRDSLVGIPGTVYRLVVDIDRSLAETVARELGIERVSDDWRDALASDIAIAAISTPNHLHAEQAVALLNAGKHVILQKPMAIDVAQCDAIVAAAQASGRTAGVYISDLEDALAWDLRDLVQGGFLGAISSVRARYAHRGGLSAQPAANYWRNSAEKTGGGSFIQLSIHHTNLLSWVLDDTIAGLSARAVNRLCPNIGGDDTSVMICDFARTGILGVFESAWNADGSAIEVYGTEGSFRLRGGQGGPGDVVANRPFSGRVLHIPEAGKRVEFAASGTTTEHCRRDNPLNQHVAFVEAVRDGRAPQVSAEIGRFDVAVARAVQLSSESGRRVAIADVLAGKHA